MSLIFTIIYEATQLKVELFPLAWRGIFIILSVSKAEPFITRMNRHVSASRPSFLGYMKTTCIFPLFREKKIFLENSYEEKKPLIILFDRERKTGERVSEEENF